MDSKTKVAGPLAAAGAVSLGLVFLGACGVGQEDTHIPPPPIRSGSQAVEQAQFEDETSSTTIAPVVIPPSPSWRMAPSPAPRRTLPPEYRISETSDAADTPEEPPDHGDTTRSAGAGPGPTPKPDAAEPDEVEPTGTSSELPEVEPAHSRSPVPAAPTGTDTGAPGEGTSPAADSNTAEPPGPVEEQPAVPTEPAGATSLPAAPVTEQPTSSMPPAPGSGTATPEAGTSTADTAVPTTTIEPGSE